MLVFVLMFAVIYFISLIQWIYIILNLCEIDRWDGGICGRWGAVGGGGVPHPYMCIYIYVNHTIMHIYMLQILKPRSSTCRSRSHNGKCRLVTVLFHIHLHYFNFLNSEYIIGWCNILINNIIRWLLIKMV